MGVLRLQKIIVIFIAVFLSSVSSVFAVTSSSTNYQIDGGQTLPIYGEAESTNFNTDSGGNPISGNTSSTNYQAQIGSALDGTTTAATSSDSGTAEAGVGGTPGASVPSARNIEVNHISETEVIITFTTDRGANVLIEYGQNGTFDLQVFEEGDIFQRDHIFTLSGLNPETAYTYRIYVSTPSREKTQVGDDFIFTTQKEDIFSPGIVPEETIEIAEPEREKFPEEPVGADDETEEEVTEEEGGKSKRSFPIMGVIGFLILITIIGIGIVAEKNEGKS